MTKEEILKMAKQAGFERLGHDDCDYVCYPDEIEAFATLIAEKQPVKMVEYICVCGKGMKFESKDGIVAPQRTWVGLTDDDKVLIKHDANFNQFMTAGEYADRVQQLTEARLKDLNT